MVAKDFKPLSNWQSYWEFLGTSPLLFNGIYLSCQPEEDKICDDFWSYYSYNNRPNISQLIQCLCKSELQIESVLGTSLFQKNYCDTIEIDRNYLTFRKPGISPEAMVFKTNSRHVIAYGQEVETDFLQDVNIVYTDTDTDGFKETAKIQFVYTLDTQLCDYKFYLVGTEYEVRPSKVVILDPLTRLAEVTFYSWDLVRTELYINHVFKQQKAVDGCAITNFIATIDIRYVSISTCKPHGFLRYTNHVCNSKCETRTIPFCVVPQDLCTGTFMIKTGSLDTNGCFIASGCPPICSCPVSLVVYYQGGLCKRCDSNCENGTCSCKEYENMVFTLAATCLSDYNTCCQCLAPNINKYQQQTSLHVKKDEITWRYSEKSRDNLFGTTVGEIEVGLSVDRMFNDTRLCLTNID